MRSKGTQTMPDKRDLLYNLKVGDKFTTTKDKNKVFQITDRKGDTTYVKEVATGKDSWFEYPDTFVIPVDESATYQKKRFKEPAYMYESVSASKIRSAEDLYEWMVEYMRKHSKNHFTSLQFILGNGNNIIIAWDMKSYKGIHEGSKNYNLGEFVYNFMEPIIKQSGISDIYEADMDTGRFKAVKEEVIVIHHPWGEEIKDYKAGDPIPAGTKFKIFKTRDQKAIDAWIDSLYESTKKLNEEYYIKWGKKYFCNMNGDPAWGPIKDFAIPFKSREEAEKYMDKMGDRFPMFYYNYDVKVVKESKKLVESVIKAYYRGPEHRPSKEGYVADKDGKILAPWKTQAYNFGSEADAAKAIKVIQKKPEWKDFTLVVEGRIAKGYENLDADEKARHLLSHPCSKYMGDLKTGNITERAIRKAVKEMLGKPDKDDPQFIIDVNEEGEAPAVATSTANVANPELPLKLKESLSSKTHKFRPEELKVGKRVIDKVGGREVHGKITVNHHDLYKDNPYTQDKRGSTVVTIVTDSGRSYDVDANDNGGEFILEGCKKVVECYKEDTEDSYKYQTSVAGGMSSNPETAESAKEHEEATSLIESIIKKSVRKKLTESVGQKLNITLIRKPQNMKEVEKDMRKGNGDRVKAIVDKSYKLSADEYDKFVYNFMVHTTYLSGEGGVDPDGTVHVVEITAPGKKTIYVDPEGYDYARYVGW